MIYLNVKGERQTAQGEHAREGRLLSFGKQSVLLIAMSVERIVLCMGNLAEGKNLTGKNYDLLIYCNY